MQVCLGYLGGVCCRNVYGCMVRDPYVPLAAIAIGHLIITNPSVWADHLTYSTVYEDVLVCCANNDFSFLITTSLFEKYSMMRNILSCIFGYKLVYPAA